MADESRPDNPAYRGDDISRTEPLWLELMREHRDMQRQVVKLESLMPEKLSEEHRELLYRVGALEKVKPNGNGWKTGFFVVLALLLSSVTSLSLVYRTADSNTVQLNQVMNDMHDLKGDVKTIQGDINRIQNDYSLLKQQRDSSEGKHGQH